MYSPKIDESLIPRLYRLGKERHMPMTELVSGMIRNALAEQEHSVAMAAIGNEPDEANASQPVKAAA